MKIPLDSISKMRKRLGITQAELAEKVGVSQAYIARLEKGTLDPKVSIVNKIFEAIESWGITCADIMSKNPVTTDARASASQVVELMLKYGFSQIPVLRVGKIVGMVTEKDIINNLMRDLEEMSVQAIMVSQCPPLVEESTRIEDVFQLFDAFQAILVQHNGRLTGIITRSDLLPLGINKEVPR